MPINVSEAIDMDTATMCIIETPIAGAWINGRYVKSTDAPTTTRLLMSVQQPSAKDLKLLSEGERSSDIRLFISLVPLGNILDTTTDQEQQPASFIVYKGKRYKVLKPKDWDDYGYREVLAARVTS